MLDAFVLSEEHRLLIHAILVQEIVVGQLVLLADGAVERR